MRIVRQLVTGVLALLAIAVGAAYLLPREITVTREVVIAAAPDKVFLHLNALQKVQEWSPWHSLDPKMTTHFAGPAEGVGNRMTWSSTDPRVGSGTQEIIVSVPDQRVETAIESAAMGVATSWSVLRPEGKGTRMTWGLLADVGNSPLGRFRGLLLGRRLGADFDRGLAALKTLAEKP